MSKFIPDAPKDDRLPEVQAEREYGKLTSKEYLFVSKHPLGEALPEPIADEPPYYVLIATLLNFLFLILVGHTRDFFGKIFKPRDYQDLVEKDGYAPWFSGFENFYVRRLKIRLDDCFARPIFGAPGRYIKLFERRHVGKGQYEFTGNTSECLNLSLYNYLGFAQSHGLCTDEAVATVNKYGTLACSPRLYVGTTDLHLHCEQVVADFVGKQSSIIVSQGYGTNGGFFASILDSKCLVISDELNHALIRFGVRLSGAVVKVFKHNNMDALENLLRQQIAQGQPKTHRPWKKIVIAVEGLYSMEGNMCNLPRLIELKQKYKCYLFVDEAHSIGALGPSGRGVCDYFQVSPDHVDILMGTFTKSFGATGGYIAASAEIINKLRLNYITNVNSESVPPPVLLQIISSLGIIEGKLNPGEGSERLKRIAFNSRYLRLGLKRLGFIVLGADDAPVIPVMLYLPAKMPYILRELYAMGIAIVVVGYPATPLTEARIRLCVSSALTKEDLDYVLEKFSFLGDKLLLKYSSGVAGGCKVPGEPPRWSLKEILELNVEDCKRPTLP